MKALAIVDGEHYPPVVRDAIAELPYDVVVAVLVGGMEKLRGDLEYGVPLAPSFEEAIAGYAPEIVVDLSDEPILGPVERFSLASRALVHRLPYLGADFRFDPPRREPFQLPSVAVVGTGKRVGKTAITGRLAQLGSTERRVVVVAMGRGGPAEPEIVSVRPTVESLVALSRAGRHAASDHLETAAVVGVETVGCRRCGGGFAGGVFSSNLEDGAETATQLGPELVVFDGSGAAVPPVATDRTIVVVGAHQDLAVATGYLNEYRLRLADLVVVTMAEEGSRWRELVAAIRPLVGDGVGVVGSVLRPRPLETIRGKRVAYFCAAPAVVHPMLAAHLHDVHGAEVVHVSGNLADRSRLAAELPDVDAEVFLVELKAAAIDAVAEHALARGSRIILAANDPIPCAGERDLDELLLEMARIRS